MAKPLPVIGRIPAEIHARAQSLGLIVETYTEVVAGHGPTGNVAWAISGLLQSGDWTDAPRFRYGTSTTHERARAELRYALDQIEASRSDLNT